MGLLLKKSSSFSSLFSLTINSSELDILIEKEVFTTIREHEDKLPYINADHGRRNKTYKKRKKKGREGAILLQISQMDWTITVKLPYFCVCLVMIPLR
jgi:hypothetical protein